MPKLTQTSSSLKLLLLRKWGDECREELSQPRIKPAEPFLILLDMTGESLCQGTLQKWASAYLVARLSSSHRELLCPNAWRHWILADSVSKPWREQGESLSRALFSSQYCGGAHQIHSPLSWDSRKHLARTEKKARTCKFGSICFSVPFRKLVSG